MEEQQPYQLICSYVKNKFFVSTAYRKASTLEPMWYFETIVWEWNQKTKERGKILVQDDSGFHEDFAFSNHIEIIQKL